MVTGILAAMDAEMELLLGQLEDKQEHPLFGGKVYTGVLAGAQVALGQSGIGTINAALWAGALCREFGAGRLINTGVAGAAAAGLRTLDVVLSSEALFYDVDHETLRQDYPFCTVFPADQGMIAQAQAAAGRLDPAPRVLVGRVATGDWFISDPEAKAKICRRFQPLCVEMEGAAVAQAAYLCGAPFLIVRTISDGADEAMEGTYMDFRDRAAQVSGSIVLELLRAGA